MIRIRVAAIAAVPTVVVPNRVITTVAIPADRLHALVTMTSGAIISIIRAKFRPARRRSVVDGALRVHLATIVVLEWLLSSSTYRLIDTGL